MVSTGLVIVIVAIVALALLFVAMRQRRETVFETPRHETPEDREESAVRVVHADEARRITPDSNNDLERTEPSP